MSSKTKEIILQDPDKLVNQCKPILQKILNNKSLELTDISGAKETYILNKGNGVEFKDDEVEYTDWIIPFFKPRIGSPYWLGMTITFNKRRDRKSFLFSQIALRIYTGDLTGIKNKLFRAEWSIFNSDSIHAQPHWHVHGLNINQKSEFKENKGWDYTEIKNFGEEENKPPKDIIKDFHFAMSSSWYIDNSNKIKIEEENQVKMWLKGCVEYIISQLNYIHK